MDIIECAKKDTSLLCREHGVLDFSRGVVKLSLNKEGGFLFIHALNETILCTGLEFQVHVWGSTKYTLWLLKPGENTCVLFKDLFLDKCADYAYVISTSPNACSKLNFTRCEEELLVKIKLSLNTPLFILLGPGEGLQIRDMLNIISHENPASCEQKLAEINSVLEGRKR